MRIISGTQSSGNWNTGQDPHWVSLCRPIQWTHAKHGTVFRLVEVNICHRWSRSQGTKHSSPSITGCPRMSLTVEFLGSEFCLKLTFVTAFLYKKDRRVLSPKDLPTCNVLSGPSNIVIRGKGSSGVFYTPCLNK